MNKRYRDAFLLLTITTPIFHVIHFHSVVLLMKLLTQTLRYALIYKMLNNPFYDSAATDYNNRGGRRCAALCCFTSFYYYFLYVTIMIIENKKTIIIMMVKKS